MQVDDDPDTGIIGKISLNGLAAPVIRAGVAGIIVNSRIVYHVQTVALKYLRELVAYPYYIIISIQRAIGAQILVFIQSGGGVGLAGVGVDNEYLRLVSLKPDRTALRQKLLRVHSMIRGVFNYEPAGYGGRHYGRSDRSFGHGGSGRVQRRAGRVCLIRL